MFTLQLALVQTHLLWENPIANRQKFSSIFKNLPNAIDIVVLPEMFTTGFTMQPTNIDVEETQKTVDWLLEEASLYNIAIVGSIVYFENDNYYNRLLFVTPAGEIQTYDKKHTFSLAGEHKVYESGTQKLVVDYKGFKICPLICYDLRFPVWSRNVESYDALLYVANWPKPRIEAWNTLLKARAIENMVYAIGVNRIGLDGLGYEYPGHSAVYDVLGKNMVFSEKEEILVVELSKEHILKNRTKLKFLEDADEFNLI
ncbi:amidohydrolase [Croceivirga lutea]|uniref:nitrilase family protein n=1 Tax=Croceivirga lutea TaxID=1775167 RepID=UPI00163A879B|nr:nitrilase family protein [Croceivirga lutea]GGG37336.1 amidohydrolase [Croceivirga lutea]